MFNDYAVNSKLVAVASARFGRDGFRGQLLVDAQKMTPSDMFKIEAMFPVSNYSRTHSLDGSPTTVAAQPKGPLISPEGKEPRRGSVRRLPSYNRQTVMAFLATYKIPCPQYEYRFHMERMWRFDLAWLGSKVALEVQGGIYSGGAHVRGAALMREWTKLNCAAGLGWRILYCSPDQLLTAETARAVKAAILFDMR